MGEHLVAEGLWEEKYKALQEHLSREIGHISGGFDSMERKIDANHAHSTNQLAELSAQVKMTNGRVLGLERWKSWMAGALATFALLMPFIVAAFSWFLYTRVNQ